MKKLKKTYETTAFKALLGEQDEYLGVSCPKEKEEAVRTDNTKRPNCVLPPRNAV